MPAEAEEEFPVDEEVPHKPSSKTSVGSKSPTASTSSRKSGHSKSPSAPRSSTKSLTESNTADGGTTVKSPETPPDAGGKKKVSSSIRKKKESRKKGITFKKTVGVHTIPNLATYTIQEKVQTWYAADDYGQMEDECDLTAELLDRRKPLWPGQCPRGLEAWTTEGEQRKEGHVQLAIDIVWQAQLEQWKGSTDIEECWEFIRSRYLAITVPCQKIANKRAQADEQEVQPYLSGVRNVEKNRLRLLGIHLRDNRTRRSDIDETPRSSNGKPKVGRAYSEMSTSSSKSPPGRNHSSDNIKAPVKGPLKKSISAEDELSAATSRKIKLSKQGKSSTPAREVTEDDISSAASSRRSKKISYQKSKSKSKIPTSPVHSLCSESDEGSVSRRMRSHMSVASDDSTRRRMLRTAHIKQPPL